MTASREAILRAIGAEVWALDRAKLEGLIAAIEIGANLQRARAAATPTARRGGRRAMGIIPIHGVLSHRASFWSELFGGTSATWISATLNEFVEDDDIATIVLDIDSPGGEVSGMPELAAEIRAAREQKPVVAVANTTAASGGYWLASQADRLYVTPSGWIGSIGVYTVHDDVSKALERMGVDRTLISAGKYKIEGNPYEPLDKAAREHTQSIVDGYYGQFVSDVAAGRRVSATTVRQDYGEGRMLLAADAVRSGMADGVAALSSVLESPAKPATIRASQGLDWYRLRARTHRRAASAIGPARR